MAEAVWRIIVVALMIWGVSLLFGETFAGWLLIVIVGALLMLAFLRAESKRIERRERRRAQR